MLTPLEIAIIAPVSLIGMAFHALLAYRSLRERALKTPGVPVLNFKQFLKNERINFALTFLAIMFLAVAFNEWDAYVDGWLTRFKISVFAVFGFAGDTIALSLFGNTSAAILNFAETHTKVKDDAPNAQTFSDVQDLLKEKE